MAVDVMLPSQTATVLVADQAVSVAVPVSVASVLAASPSVSVEVPPSVVSVVCDDQIDVGGFVTPTLVDWSVLAEDLETSGARVSVVELTTDGSPCRVKLSLVHASASETYATKYSSPEQLAPHVGPFTTILATPDRGLTYDLYWSWTSGNESGGPELVAAAAIYVPLTGEGDYPAEA